MKIIKWENIKDELLCKLEKFCTMDPQKVSTMAKISISFFEIAFQKISVQFAC